MKFFLYLIIVAFIIFLVERVLRKKLGVKHRYVSETSGKKIYNWVKLGMLIVFIIGLIPVVSLDEFGELFLWYIFSNLILSNAFDTFMEWKYLKRSKQYVISSAIWVIGLSAMLIYVFVLQ
ncbi:DUF4181 domain-containing protein [Alkalihalophilus pseudofirmus]|uniref:DUF4181 domain-containing protein n=1 Tax=Alkalihalophilus pseudofirmus TaxID=79885 RepID=A0AAJ2KV96_ALKPS|nr:DUF4181 domain-containing protein [Alkalihalophilus pseudofirmus]MDV2884498.1 DUF4181 domain-containing protein [Alkalihalophilus pseudofirmus]